MIQFIGIFLIQLLIANSYLLIYLFVFFMKKIAFLILITTFAMNACADMKLAEKNACLACHSVDKKLVGPSYQSIAEKYAKEKDYVAKLATSIKAGGSGKYGPIPMPAQAALADADATKLAKWILAGAK
jgi:cytochrome c